MKLKQILVESEYGNIPYLSKFFKLFPRNTSSWAEATDEIRDIAKMAREYYTEYDLKVVYDDPKAMQPLNFRSINSPSEWNIKGQDYTIKVYNMMSNETKKIFLRDVKDRFISNRKK